MEWFVYVSTAVVCYLLGSVPTGYCVARAKGIDIRALGSGNIGATNVFRIVGKTAGIMVLLMDCLKGFAACAVVAPWIFRTWMPQSSHTLLVLDILKIVAGLSVLVGHNYTCWLKFKGGKGIATSAGVLIALVPWALLIILSVWIVLFALTRLVSLASIAAALTLPIATWLTEPSRTLLWVTTAMTCLAVYKHRSNVGRLLKGTETRLEFTKKETPR